MTELQTAMCEGKKKYLTYEHAKHDSDQMKSKYNVIALPYHCRYCNYWHVGTNRRQTWTG